MSYTKQVSFRVTAEEKGQVESLAVAQGMSVSDYARSCVLGPQSTTGTPSSTPTVAYSALNSRVAALTSSVDDRLATMEDNIQRAISFLREEDSGNSN